METLINKVKSVKDTLRKEIQYQASTILGIDEITYNIELYLTLLNEIDKLDDNLVIKVTDNPMGCLQYEVINIEYYQECLFYLTIEIYNRYLKEDHIMIDLLYDKMCEITYKYLDQDDENKSLLDSVQEFIENEKDFILENINESVYK